MKTEAAIDDPELRAIWVPTGLLLGFQVTLFKWRLEREAEVGDKGDIPWLVPSDYISILRMLSFVVGVILLPVSEIASVSFARSAFGLGALLFVGQHWDWQPTINSTIVRRAGISCGFQRKRRSLWQ